MGSQGSCKFPEPDFAEPRISGSWVLGPRFLWSVCVFVKAVLFYNQFTYQGINSVPHSCAGQCSRIHEGLGLCCRLRHNLLVHGGPPGHPHNCLLRSMARLLCQSNGAFGGLGPPPLRGELSWLWGWGLSGASGLCAPISQSLHQSRAPQNECPPFQPPNLGTSCSQVLPIPAQDVPLGCGLGLGIQHQPWGLLKTKVSGIQKQCGLRESHLAGSLLQADLLETYSPGRGCFWLNSGLPCW